jgi:hypothetical protein
MKTTSYEISKKLKEAGFEAETNFYWYCYDNGREMRHIADADGKGDVEAYDLETLLDALPESIQYKKYKSSDWYYLFLRAPSRFSETNKTLGYYNKCSEYMDNFRMGEEHGIFEVSKLSPNESLADVAGKMWLMLKEKGLIC